MDRIEPEVIELLLEFDHAFNPISSYEFSNFTFYLNRVRGFNYALVC